jgi:predicted anti-sigma-YlaC factor YlaD
MLLRPKRAIACPALEARLEDYLEARLDSRETGEVENHLRFCARCSGALAGARTSRELLGIAAVSAGSASPGFVSRVMATVAGERQRLESWKPVEAAAWRLCWVATAAVLLLTAALVRVQMSAPPVGTAQQSQVETLISVPAPQPANADDTVLLVARETDVR